MRYRSRSDSAQLSSDVATFVDLLGQPEYLQLLRKLGAGLNYKGYVTVIDDLRYSLELQLLNLELLRIRNGGVLSGMPNDLHEAVDFAIGVGQTIPHLSAGARKELRGRLIGGLKTNGLRPLQHEFRIASAVSRLGYDVGFADLEGKSGGFDFLAEGNGGAFEVEGKCVPAFLGQAIQPEDAEKLFLALVQKFSGWAEDTSIPILSATLGERLNVKQSAISKLVEACNSAARTRATAVVDDYATVKFLGAVPEASLDRLSEIVEIDRASTWTNVFLSLKKPRLVLRLSSSRPSKFLPNILDTISDAAKRQLSGKRPGIIWVHVDYLDPQSFASLVDVANGPGLFDLLAIAVLDSPKRHHICQLVISGGPHLVRQDGYSRSQSRIVVYNAPNCSFGTRGLFPGGRNLKPSAGLTGEKAKSLLVGMKFNFSLPSGPKDVIAATTAAFFQRLSNSAEPTERLFVASALFRRALGLSEQGRSARALAVYDKLLDEFLEEADPRFHQVIAGAFYNRGNMLGELGKPEDALAAYETLVRRFGTSDVCAIRENVARALYNSAKILERDVGRLKDAIRAYDEVVQRFRESTFGQLPTIVAQALVNKGVLLGSSEAAVRVYDDVIEGFGASSEDCIRKQVEKALINKGRVLMAEGRAEAALDAFDAVLGFARAAEPTSKSLALFWKIEVLSSLEQQGEIPKLCDELAASIGPATELHLKEAGANALLRKASILKNECDRIGELATYDTLLSKFGTDTDRTLVMLSIVSQEHRVEALISLGQLAEALVGCDDIVARCGETGRDEYSEHIAWALSTKAFVLAQEERLEDAARVCSQIVNRFWASSTRSLLDSASRALVERASHYLELGRLEEAISDCDTFVATSKSATEPASPETMARSLLIKGSALFEIERTGDAARVLSKILGDYGGVTEPPIGQWVACARDLLREIRGE